MTLLLGGTIPSFLSSQPLASDFAERLGFRFGRKGTHTSRTIMLAELTALIGAVPPNARRPEYAAAIIDDNCLAKPTTATRRLTAQRLSELYGLDLTVALFRVLRHLWDLDVAGRPLLALLAAIARDPLLAASAEAILPLPLGAEYSRDAMRTALRRIVGERLNDSTLDKVACNAASSWTQSGHLRGRTLKRRAHVHATFATVAYALYLAHGAGFRGEAILSSSWLEVVDTSVPQAQQLALEAKRQGLIDLRMGGDVMVLDVERIDPLATRR